MPSAPGASYSLFAQTLHRAALHFFIELFHPKCSRVFLYSGIPAESFRRWLTELFINPSSVYRFGSWLSLRGESITVKHPGTDPDQILLRYIHRVDPFSGQHHKRSAHCRNACCIADCLASYFVIAFLMITYIVDIVCFFLFPSFTPVKIHPMLVFPLVRGPRLAGSGSSAFKNWIGTISCPLYSIGVVESIPTSSRQRI